MQQAMVPAGVMQSGMQPGMMPQVMHPGVMLPGMTMHPGLMPQFGGESTPNSDGEEEERAMKKTTKRGRSSSPRKRRRRAETKEKKRKRGKRQQSSPSETESGESGEDDDIITDDHSIRRQCKRLGGCSKDNAYSLAGRFDIVKTCLDSLDIDLLRANRISLCVQSVVRARHPTHVREPLAFSLSPLSLSLSLSLSLYLRRTGPGIVGPDPVRRPAPSQPPKGRFVETVPGTGPGD